MDLNIIKIAADLLELASDEFSSHSHNNYDLENILENQEIISEMNEDDNLNISKDGKIIHTDDWALMEFCVYKLREFVKVEELKIKKGRKKK